MNRVLIAHTPLGEDWWAVSLQGNEALSSLYEFRLQLKSKKHDIDIQSMIGEACAVECKGDLFASIRYFSGLVVHATAKGKSGKHWLYELTIAPKLWFASRRADFKIYQNLTVQAIADEVLQQNAINFEWRLKNSYKTWEYVVQYGETDLAFLLRLFGHEGIYFWFEHSDGGEKLILGDHFSVHEPFAGYETIPYYPPDASRPNEDHFHTWHASRIAEPGKFVHTSYDFKSPSKDLKTECTDPCGHLFDQYEIFSYSGAYTESGHGQDYAAARLYGMQGDHDIIVLEGVVRGAIPGYNFTLKKHPVDEHNREFTIVSTEYRIRNNEYEADNYVQSEEADFHAKVSAMPAERQYRAPLSKFRMPRAHGPDTAVVVGPSGSEIHTDKYGRIKVHFHWDRYGQKDGNDSCWIRVSYAWAGSNFGGINIPRVGQEVIIDYEHGDPQRPLVTGCVYNAEQMPPWDLPANKTQSGFLTRSSLQGSSANANAIRFEDAKGQEEVWLHAEKDQRIEVENDESHWVGNDRSKTVDHDETVHVKNDRTETVDNNETITVHNDRTEEVDGNETITIHKDRTEEVDGNETITVHKDRTEEVDGNEEITVHKDRTRTVDGIEDVSVHMDRTKNVDGNETDRIGKNWSINVDKNKTETIAIASVQNVGAARMDNVGAAYNLNVGAAQINDIGGLYSVNVGMAMTTMVGMSQTTKVGKSVTVTAGDSITLICGKSKLVMKKDGTISLNGKDIKTGATGKIHQKASGAITIKGSKVGID